MALMLRDSAPTASVPGAAPGSPQDQEISGFLLRSPKPSSTDVANFLQLYRGADRDAAAHKLIAAGVDSGTVGIALSSLDAMSKWNWNAIGGVLAVASAAVSGYHGYRRNNSLLWGAIWFGLGGIFPVFTPVVALAQGFGKRKAA